MTTQKTTQTQEAPKNNPLPTGVQGFIFGMVPAPHWGAQYYNGSFQSTLPLICWAGIVNDGQDSTEIVGMVLNDENEIVPARSIEGFVKYTKHLKEVV